MVNINIAKPIAAVPGEALKVNGNAATQDQTTTNQYAMLLQLTPTQVSISTKKIIFSLI